MSWSQLEPSLVRKMGSEPCVRSKRTFTSSAEMVQPWAGRWHRRRSYAHWCLGAGKRARSNQSVHDLRYGF